MSRVIMVRSRAFTPSVDRFAVAVARRGNRVLLLRWNRDGRAKAANSDNPKFIYFDLIAPYDRLSAALMQPLWQLYLFLTLVRADVDIIHACDLDTLLPAMFASRLRRRKLLYTIYDFYADNLPLRIPALLRKGVAELERACTRKVDWLFLVNEHQTKQLESSLPKDVSMIYNTPVDARQGDRETAAMDRGEDRSLVIFYAGNLHESRGLKFAVEATSELPSCELEIAGTGPEEARLRELAQRLGSRVQFLGWLPHQDVINHSLHADVILGLYDPGIPGNQYASPNKLFEAMMCEKPFLTNGGTYAAKVTRDERCGLVVPYGDVAALRQAIALLQDNSTYRRELGTHGRHAYETKYSWTEMENRVATAYRSIARRDSPPGSTRSTE